jgi:ribosomal protein S18 acetylase RimI-like enzyme
MRKEKTAKFDSDSLALRAALPEDSAEAAKLIFMTGAGIFKYLFYPQDDRTCRVLQGLFELDNNEFSFRNVTIAEVESKIGGLIHCVDRTKMIRNYKAMGSKMIRVMGLFPALVRMPRSIQFECIFPDIDPDTLYIGHLSTFEAYRRQGIADRLLAFSEQLARQKRLAKQALDVELDNELAIAVYERYGFKIATKIESPKFKVRFGFPGAYRMERAITL